MSFDLFFCRTSGECVAREEFEGFARANPHLKAVDSDAVEYWLYENDATGVNFTFHFASETQDDKAEIGEDQGEALIPSGFVDARLAFNMNFCRPSFFALEAMPVVEQLCATLGLLVVDPQEHAADDRPLPKPARVDELVASWQTSNRWAIRRMPRDGWITSMNVWNRDSADAWFRYQSQVASLGQRLAARGMDIYVPNLFLVSDSAAGGKIRVLLCWTDGIPFVFPPCDLVMIQRIQSRWLGLRKQVVSGWTTAEYVRGELRPFLSTFSTEAAEFDLLTEDGSRDARSVSENLAFDTDLSRFARATADQVVDEPLEDPE